MAAENLPPGSLRWSENLIARSGGGLGVRPGFVGQLSAVLPGAITAAIEFVHAGGVALLVAVAGQGIYRWEMGANAAVKISGAVDFGDCETVNFAALDAYVFVSGAVDGKLYRYDGAAFVSAMGLLAPAQALAAEVQALGTLLAPTDITRWKSRWVNTSSNLISETESYFPAGSAIRTDSVGSTTARVMEFLNPPGGTSCIELQPNASGDLEWTEFDPFALPVSVADFLGAVAPAADGGRADFARSTYFVAAEDTLSLYPGGTSYVEAFSDAAGTVPLPGAKARLDHGELSKEKPTLASLLWDGRGRGAASIRQRWEYSGLDTGKGIDVTRAGLVVFGQKFQVVNVAGRAEVRQGSFPAEEGRVLVNGAWLEYALPVVAAWSSGRGYLSVSAPPGVSGALVRVSVSGGAGSAEVGTLNITQDSSEYELDLSGVPAAILAAVAALRFTFLADVQVLGATDGTNVALLSIGALLDAGPLSVGLLPYRWRIVETVGGVSSPAGALSAALAPTTKGATGKIVFSAGATNGGASWEVYRLGGVISSWRQVAVFAPGVNASGAGWSWDSASKTFLDFTTDEELTTAEDLLDHAGPPVGARAIATFARRLAVLTDTELWLSRAEVGAAAGLYFDTANDPTAANYTEQGGVFQSVAAAGLSSVPGAALRLVAWDSRLVALYSGVLLSLSGDSPATWEFLAMEFGTGGLLSRRAVCVHMKRLVWLSGVGLLSLSPGSFIDASGDSSRRYELGRLGAEVSGITGIGAEEDADSGMVAALGGSALWSADSRLYWSLPDFRLQAAHPAAAVGALSGYPALLVQQGESKGWYLWRSPVVMRGGASVRSRRGFVALGTNGQLFRVADGFGDKALAASGAAPVSFVARSAWRGSGDVAHRVISAGFSARSSAQVVVTLQAWTIAGLWSPATWKIPGGNVPVSPRRIRFDRVLRGSRVSWQVSGSSSGDIVFNDVELHDADGGLFERA
jgi:hypothetical protein